MDIGIYVNTEKPMSLAMMEALTEYEFQCVFTGKKSTTVDDVRGFLSTKHGDDLAHTFTHDFMVPATSKDPQ